MKTFAEWLATGPLAGEQLSDRERTLLNIAYNEGATERIEAVLAAPVSIPSGLMS